MNSLNKITAEQSETSDIYHISDEIGGVAQYDNGEDIYYFRFFERREPVFKYDQHGQRIDTDEEPQTVGYAVLSTESGHTFYDENGTVYAVRGTTETYQGDEFKFLDPEMIEFRSQMGRRSEWFGSEGTHGGWHPNDTSDLNPISLQKAANWYFEVIQFIKHHFQKEV